MEFGRWSDKSWRQDETKQNEPSEDKTRCPDKLFLSFWSVQSCSVQTLGSYLRQIPFTQCLRRIDCNWLASNIAIFDVLNNCKTQYLLVAHLSLVGLEKPAVEIEIEIECSSISSDLSGHYAL